MYFPPSSMIATGLIFPLLGVITTGIRFWIRLRYQPNPLGIDDWMISVGATIVMSLGVLQVFDTIFGEVNNDKAWSAGEKAIVKWKADYAQTIIEKVGFGAIKLSILFFYRRIFSRWSDFRKWNMALVIFVAVWSFVYLIGEVLVCGIHPGVLWTDRKATDYMCMDHGAFLISYAASDVLTDVLVIGMPVPFIHRIQVSSRQKWGLVAVFFMGFVSTMAGILRLSFLCIIYYYGQFKLNPPTLENPPKILTYINPIFWTNLEISLGVVAANLMTFGPLIRRGKSKQGGSRKNSNNTNLMDNSNEGKSRASVTTTTEPMSRTLSVTSGRLV